jgi:hypothetical protein
MPRWCSWLTCRTDPPICPPRRHERSGHEISVVPATFLLALPTPSLLSDAAPPALQTWHISPRSARSQLSSWVGCGINTWQHVKLKTSSLKRAFRYRDTLCNRVPCPSHDPYKRGTRAGAPVLFVCLFVSGAPAVPVYRGHGWGREPNLSVSLYLKALSKPGCL